jgi:membrane-associated phospholipid phosphatase
MTLSGTLRPVDRLMVLFNVGFGVLWLAGLGRVPAAPWLVFGHAAGVLLAWLAGRLGPGASPIGRGLRELYPIVLISLYWLEMGLVRHGFHDGTYDAVIAVADQWMSGGTHLQLLWMPAMPWVWFSEMMYAVYWLYYPMVFGTPLALLVWRRPSLEPFVFRVTLAYVACYVSYAIFPVDGPSHTMEKFVGPHMEGFFYNLVVSGTHAADSMGTAFPSSHVVGAVTAALVAVQWFSRPWAVVFLLGALGVALSTVYTQSHFAIDSVIGIVFAAVLYYPLAPVLERWLGGRPAPMPSVAGSVPSSPARNS